LYNHGPFLLSNPKLPKKWRHHGAKAQLRGFVAIETLLSIWVYDVQIHIIGILGGEDGEVSAIMIMIMIIIS
jgi:hypothetical protein